MKNLKAFCCISGKNGCGHNSGEDGQISGAHLTTTSELAGMFKGQQSTLQWNEREHMEISKMQNNSENMIISLKPYPV